MNADHDRLDALRRLANDRAATPAEKATARRLAKALAAKIGKRHRRSRRKGHGLALPEPPAARWRRQWVVWLKAGHWLYGVWIVSFIGLGLVSVFGSEAVQRQASDVYLVRTLGPLAVVFAMIAIGGLLAFAAWLLKTWRNERLRPRAHIPNEARAWVCDDDCLHLAVCVPGGSLQVTIVARIRDVFGPDVRDQHSMVALGVSHDRARPAAGEPGVR